MLTSTPIQSTYTRFMKQGIVGGPATETGWDVNTCIAEDPLGDGIGFGLAVCQGTFSDHGATLGQLSGGAFVGITRADSTLPNISSATLDKYQNTENMGVQVRGDIWVAPTAAVVAGGPVYFNSVTGQLGPSSISNAVLISNARWMTSYPIVDALMPASDLAIVRLGSLPTA